MAPVRHGLGLKYSWGDSYEAGTANFGLAAITYSRVGRRCGERPDAPGCER